MRNTENDSKAKYLPQNRKKLATPPIGNYSNITPTVEKISRMNLDGNIIPHTWYTHIVKKTKRGTKPHLNAIVILADVIYWYRATTVQDEADSSVLERKKKFYYDKLQKSYKDYADKFGLSAKVVKEAVDFLKKEGLITCEFVCYKPNQSSYINNQMYIEPIADKIAEITYSFPKKTKSAGSTYRNREVVLAEIGNTYTETTNTNTTDKDIRSLKDLDEALSSDLLKTQEGFFRNTGSSFAAPNKKDREEKIEVAASVQPDGLTKQLTDDDLKRFAADATKGFHKNKFSSSPYELFEERPKFNLNDSKSLQELENLKWLQRNRNHMLQNCKWAYETTKPSLCEFIFEANCSNIPIEYSKRTYELWHERGWAFTSGDKIKHWVGALNTFYKKRCDEITHASESYNTCAICGTKYQTPVLDYQPEEGDEPECSGCHTKIEYIVDLSENNC